MREWWNTVGRPTIGSRPMTPAERQRRSRSLRALRRLRELEVAGKVADHPEPQEGSVPRTPAPAAAPAPPRR